MDLNAINLKNKTSILVVTQLNSYSKSIKVSLGKRSNYCGEHKITGMNMLINRLIKFPFNKDRIN